MNIIITGAYGQLGSELKEIETDFPKSHFHFTDVDTLDITDESAVKIFFNEKQPDFVINCAAYTAVDKAENKPEAAEKVNAVAPKILAKACKKNGAKFIHVSTDYVFSGDANQPYLETDAVDPQGVYGKTKLKGEINCMNENADSVIIRTSWLYSGFGNNFVNTMLRIGRERDVLNVVFDQVGTPTYAADLADVIMNIIGKTIEKPESFIPGVYHFSNEGVASWYDFAKAIFEIREMDCKVNSVCSDAFPTPAKRPHYSVLNKSKIRNNFGIEVPYWRDSLKVCLRKFSE